MNLAKPVEQKRVATLDGARWLAAMIVVISHAANAELLPAILGHGFGQTGVVLFFLISGYLLSDLYLRKPFSIKTVKSYAVRRLARVMPLYLVVLGLAALLLGFFNLNIYVNANFKYIIQSAFVIRGFSVFWTVPVEMHFYVIFIGLWFFAARNRSIHVILVLLLLQVTLLFFFTRFVSGTNWITYWLHIFLLGVLLSRVKSFWHTSPLNKGRIRFQNEVTVIVLFLGAILLPPEVRLSLGLPSSPRYADPYVIIFLCFFLWQLVNNVSAVSFLGMRAFRLVGTISYSIYIIHIPLLELTKYLIESKMIPHYFGFLFLLVSTLAVAAFTFLLIERPMIQWARKIC